VGSDVIILYHGTDLNSANNLLNNGLDASQAAQYNVTGEFWATESQADSDWFARTNPAAGTPARFEFEISEQDLQYLLNQGPQFVQPHGSTEYEFMPPSFPYLNQRMTGKRVVLVP
jgi:hypothetical protein